MISVLLVDDKPAYLKRAKHILEAEGDISVSTAASGKKALTLLKEKKFDLIIVEYDLQGMNCVELIDALRSQGDFTPVIVYASKNGGDEIIKAMHGGAELYMQKSDDTGPQLAELKCIIGEIAKRRRAEETLRRRDRDFHALVEKNADAMIVLNMRGVVQYVNPAAIKLFSLSRKEFVGKIFGFPILLDEPVELYVLREFREFVAVEMRMVEVEWEDEPSYLVSLRDVTAHIRLEEELSKDRRDLDILVQERTSELMEANLRLQGEIEERKVVEEELSVEVEERRTTEEELLGEIDQRAKAEEALAEAKAQADLYMDLMGHDINNLNQIGIGYLEIAMASSDPDEMRELMEKPLEVMKSASQIIENVRKIKNLDETKGEAAIKVINLCSILPDLKERYVQAHGRDITINLEMPPICFVKANELIKDVFSNLIDNAIKHSDAEKPLIININLMQVREKGRMYYLLAVEDNGPGIPSYIKDRIFLRFQRGDTKAHGKGLGLYLVKRLIEGYKGAIWVEDRVPGNYKQGTKFVIMLPTVQ